MMSSSSDELLRGGVGAAIDVENLRVIRGKRIALDDISVQIARGTITGLLGPSGCGKTTLMRSIVGTQIIADGHRHGARPARPDRPTCATASATSPRTRPSTTTCGSSTTSATSPRCTARTPTPPTTRSPPSASTTTEPPCAATFPAASAPGRRWPARWCRTPTCWCSTNPPSASIPCCGSTCGSSSTSSPSAARRCWSPATSWTRPTTAATCC